ncbi:hypothetical protein G5B39_10460 [Rhodobacteraceae bacterium SC52]|nr:hypothetical protein G5B39_10460 [Rhodobacteraceae bacterium SC52]
MKKFIIVAALIPSCVLGQEYDSREMLRHATRILTEVAVSCAYSVYWHTGNQAGPNILLHAFLPPMAHSQIEQILNEDFPRMALEGVDPVYPLCEPPFDK